MTDKYSNRIGEVFGDYIMDRYVGLGHSGHKLYAFKCQKCGHEVITSPYEMIKGRISNKCKHCASSTPKKINSTSVKPNNNTHTVKITVLDNSNKVKQTADNDTSSDVESDVDVDTTTHTPRLTEDGYEILEEAQISSNISSDITFRVVKRDIKTIPFYYHIAHVIPKSLRLRGGTISRFINEHTNMEYQLQELYEELPDVVRSGDVLKVANIFNLILGHRDIRYGYVRPSLVEIEDAVETLANYCVLEKIRYLAMPKICCGHNGYNWDNDIKHIVFEKFQDAYVNTEDILPITITVCVI